MARDDLFGEELNLADDVSGGADMDSALESERIGPKDEGSLTPEEENLLRDAEALRSSKPDAVAAFEADKEEPEGEEPPMEEGDDEPFPA